tara:strand:- start:2127 stop:2363 length:237 start_codon:yes stop_codon:yes gene_type:complete
VEKGQTGNNLVMGLVAVKYKKFALQFKAIVIRFALSYMKQTEVYCIESMQRLSENRSQNDYLDIIYWGNDKYKFWSKS